MKAAPKYDTPVRPLLAKVTNTSSGFPADLRKVREIYGVAMNAPEQGWFWIFATPRAWLDIRRRGLHAVGTEITTLIPPDGGSSADVPPMTSPEWIDLMLEESASESDQYTPGAVYWTEAPEEPVGPLRKVIVFRLKPA